VAGLILAISLLNTSCLKYQAHPLSPVQTEQQFRARSLRTPGLAEFVRAQSGAAATPWPPATLDPEMLTYIAYYFSPSIEVARAKVASARAALDTAHQRINPSISGNGGYNRTPDSVSTYAVSPAFTIETAGKRGYRILEAEKLTEASRLAVYEAAWEVRSALRRALVTYWTALSKQKLLQTEAAVRAEIVAIYQKRVELGDAATPELSAARSEQATVSLALEATETELAEARSVIAQAAGLPAAALDGVTLDLSSFQTPAAPDALPILQIEKAGLLHRADIRRTLLEYEAADARLRLALANQYPNIILSPAYTFQEGFPAYTLGAATQALPVFHRNQGPVAEQEAARLQLAAQFKALQSRIVGETQSALLDYRETVNDWRAVRDTFLPIQQQREAQVTAAFRAGETDRLDLTQSRLLTLAAQRADFEALVRAQTALGTLEDAVQSPLQPSLPAPRPETTN